MYNYFYSSILFNKLTQKLLKCGKKEKIEVLIQKAILNFARKGLKTKWIFLFFEILNKIRPIIKLTPQFVHKQKVLVPSLITNSQQYKIGIDWVVNDLRNEGWKISLRNKFIVYFENIYIHKHKYDKRKDEHYEKVIKYRSYRRYRWN